MSQCYGCGDPIYIDPIKREGHDFCSNTCAFVWKSPMETPAPEFSSGPILPPGGKPTNPKDMIGSDKLPVHLWPETATALGCLGLLDGALKYGRGNFRAIGVRSSIYVDAAKRHLNAWFEGEDIDAEEDGGSGLPHLAHALATIAILVDAQAAGKLTDDRNFPGGYRALVQELTPHVKRLKDKHADKAPKHYIRATAVEVP